MGEWLQQAEAHVRWLATEVEHIKKVTPVPLALQASILAFLARLAALGAFPQGEQTLISGELVTTVRTSVFVGAFEMYREALKLRLAMAAFDHNAKQVRRFELLRCLQQVIAQKRDGLTAASTHHNATGGEVGHLNDEGLIAARARHFEIFGHGGAPGGLSSGEQESTERAASFLSDHGVTPPS